MRSAKWLVLWLLVCLFISAAYGQTLSDDLLKGIAYRNLGPFRAGAWISDIAVPERPANAHLYSFYVGARNGGVWKTTNNGTTFEPIFDDQDVTSIGCLAIAPSNSDIVWVGTGDAANARSSYAGNGVYKSTDAGKSWQRMGLPDSQHIARIVVHPTNPDLVYVAAMGHLFTPNQERGVFKTTDGGKTWTKVLYINDKVGVIDLVIDRHHPNTLYAAAYEKQRFPWRFDQAGPESSIYKTIDAGRTWHRLTGGLPQGQIGRIGLDIYQKNPNTLYAVVENVNKRPPTEEEANLDRGRKLEPQSREIGGELYRTDDGGRSWRKMNSPKDPIGGKAAYSFNQLRVDQNNPDRVFITGESLASSDDAGKTWKGLHWGSRGLFSSAFGDFRTFWIDPDNSERMLAGSDGGVFISYDGGQTCRHFLNLKLGEFYTVAVDNATPYNVYGGLQDHESWKGPSIGRSGYIGIEDWTTVGTGDGMYNQVDTEEGRYVFNTSQFGDHFRLDQRTGARKRIMPARSNGEQPLRFNWVAPIKISPHNPHILYAGAQVLLRSLDRGEHWQEISPDLTTNDPQKISPPGSTIQFCTITTISESPLTPGVIWVGTDDGKVQMTRNGGATWTDATAALAKAGAPEDAWVTRIFASQFKPGTAYVAKSRWRQDDPRPFLYVTTDFGATWNSLASNLPNRTVNVIVEDTAKPDLLFAGTDGGLFASNNAGKTWVSMRGNMPAVPVQDLVVHPRDGEIVVGSYGRGAWITDITPLRELSGDVLAKEVHVFPAKSHPRLIPPLGNYRLYGDAYPLTPNDTEISFTYYLKNVSKDKVKVIVSDMTGGVVTEFATDGKAGLNQGGWDVTDARHRPVRPGQYVITVQVGEKKYNQDVQVRATGELPALD